MQNIFILTGAGISAPSGLQTFRGDEGLWNGHRLEDVATPYAFEDNPNLVNTFYNERRSDLSSVKPNAAHIALTDLFESERLNSILVTQNVDNLHERGGIENVIHMHGELKKARCVDCWHITSWYGDLSIGDMCPNCNGKLRPHIVWFGESPFDLHIIDRRLKDCDLFLSIGTSGQVAPASNFVEIAKEHGAKTIEFNLEETAISEHFDECLTGDIIETLPMWIDSFLSIKLSE